MGGMPRTDGSILPGAVHQVTPKTKGLSSELSFQVLNPDDQRLEPKTHPFEKGKPSEPNLHFFVPC